MAAAGAGAAALVVLWATAIEPRYLDIQRLDADLPHLGPSWAGQRVALLADFQIGIRFGNTDTARRAVKRAVEAQPAVVFLAGDFVYDAVHYPDPALATLKQTLQPLSALSERTFAVLGNHDYGEEGSRLARLKLANEVRLTLESLGIRVLENEAVRITSAQSEPLYVVGIGPHIPDKDDPPAAVARVPEGEPRIVVMHNPTSFAELPRHSAPLALAGHTHGG
ncbi:MAG: metallophosphoesterase, partial [Chloroflexi bacterium]|nr:metallophosphoesterase [Chloroflexota bacterium]